MQVPNYEDMYESWEVKYTTIKQGNYKDVGSPGRPLTSEGKVIRGPSGASPVYFRCCRIRNMDIKVGLQQAGFSGN